MKILRAFFRFIAFVTLAVAYIGTASVIGVLFRDRSQRRQVIAGLVSKFSGWTLKMMGVRVYTKDFAPEQGIAPGSLITCNHMSYLDVLVIASKFPSAFITSQEMRETPFLGLLTELGGCLYVERRTKVNLSQEIADVTQTLKSGLSVVLFPEATSTNGESVLRFRRPLFQAAIDAGSPVVPFTLNYASISGDGFHAENRDSVCWYGDMPFLSHLLNLFSQWEVTAVLTKHALIEIVDQDNTQLAEQSHAMTTKYFHGCKPKSLPTVETSSSFSLA